MLGWSFNLHLCSGIQLYLQMHNQSEYDSAENLVDEKWKQYRLQHSHSKELFSFRQSTNFPWLTLHPRLTSVQDAPLQTGVCHCPMAASFSSKLNLTRPLLSPLLCLSHDTTAYCNELRGSNTRRSWGVVKEVSLFHCANAILPYLSK